MEAHTRQLVAVLETHAGKPIKTIFRDAVSGGGPEKQHALAVLRENPERSIALLQYGQHADIGLTPRGAADVLDAVVGEVKDPDLAAQMMLDNLTVERAAELLSGRGDLPSTATHIADLSMILATIDRELRHASSPEEAIMAITFWAYKLKERDDFDEILEHDTAGHQFRWYVLADLWLTHGKPMIKDLDSLSPDLFEDLGMHSEDARERLTEMLAEGELDEFSSESFATALKEHSDKQAELKAQPVLIDDVVITPEDSVVAAAEAAADELDL